MRFRLTAVIGVITIALTCIGIYCEASRAPQVSAVSDDNTTSAVRCGAERLDLYIDSLRGKRVALLSNHTGMIGEQHLLDVLLAQGINVTRIFSPEHGFRGTADAGEQVSDSKDPKTGVEIVSLYNRARKSKMADYLADVDVVLFDLQDVGLRYYTYYCTMIDMMNAAITADKPFIVLDRPNPNGMYVDGPILDMKYKSGVGRLPIPIVHGMTLGELAQMANGEGWLKDGGKVRLTVIPCEGYTHSTRYHLPIAPSPNLQTMTAVYLYPSLCYFEATPVSVGRGTDSPFMIYGHPEMSSKNNFKFTPHSTTGAKNPPLLGKLCNGRDLSNLDDEAIIAAGINLEYLIDAYNQLNKGDKFFTLFFELLIGRGDIRGMIESGCSAEQIKKTWADDVERFKQQRRPYLLYDE